MRKFQKMNKEEALAKIQTFARKGMPSEFSMPIINLATLWISKLHDNLLMPDEVCTDYDDCIYFFWQRDDDDVVLFCERDGDRLQGTCWPIMHAITSAVQNNCAIGRPPTEKT